jgi:ribose transport system permease protein
MDKYLDSIKRSRTLYSFIGLMILVAISSIMVKNFMTVDNIITIFRQASTLLILSAGLTAVIIMAEIDLSVGAASGFIGCACAQFLKAGTPVWLVFLLGMVIGVLVGIVNGFLVGTIKMPSFIATYGISWVLTGLSVIVMNGAVIFGLPEGFTWYGTGYVGPIPVIVIIAAIVVAISYILLERTTFGRDIYSVGFNPDAALYSAVPVKKTIYATFVLSGITAGLGGLLMMARLNAADATMGDAYGMQTIAVVIVGGTSLLGGIGGMTGTIIGALLLTIIVNVMNLIGITSFAQPMVVGILILVVVIFDSIVRTKQEAAIE